MTIPPTDDDFAALERERLAALDDALTALIVVYKDYGVPREAWPAWVRRMETDRCLMFRVDSDEPS